MMIAQQVNMIPYEFIHTLGDAHIYKNQIEQVKEQLSREPKLLPQMRIRKAEDIFSYKYEDFKLTNYDPHPHIKIPVAV